MSIDALPPLPASPGNPLADDPRAVALGHRLFFDTRLRASDAVACATCHQLANVEFHNTGIMPRERLPEDRGRVEGVKQLLEDEFNCLGEFSGAAGRDCAELAFVRTHGSELLAAFRTPSLRNVASAGGPYMHDGRFGTLREALEQHDEARPTLISDELEPLGLSEVESGQLEALLHALDGPLATAPELLRPP